MPHTPAPVPATFGRLIIQVGRKWRRRIDQVLVEHGLSQSTVWPLIALHIHGAPMRQGALAEEVGIEGPSIVRLIDILEQGGLIERREDPSDRRARIIALTLAGEEKTRELDRILEAVRHEILSTLNPRDLDVAHQVMAQLDALLTVAPAGTSETEPPLGD